MVAATKPAQCPDSCHCDHHRAEQVLSKTGGWEWVDNGRPAPQPEPSLPWAWRIIEACVWLWAAVTIGWCVFGW